MRVTLGNEIGRLSYTSVIDSISVPDDKNAKYANSNVKLHDDLSDLADACCPGRNLLCDSLSDEAFNNQPSAPMLSQWEIDDVNNVMIENQPRLVKTYSSVAAIKPKEDLNPSHITFNKLPTIVVKNNKMNRYRPRHKSVDSEGYTRFVSRKKLTTGNKKSFDNVGFKSAVKYVDLYLGRCENTCNPDTITNYLTSELKITPVECVQIETKIRFSTAFKITVDVKDKDTLFEPSSWPDGVVCRKFYSNRTNK